MQPHSSSAFKFVILLECVSLCADATYEGARSITGAHLGALGAVWTRNPVRSCLCQCQSGTSRHFERDESA